MDDHKAFHQAIAEDPACDTRRLVYADWLEEHGNVPAADYLRTELELAKLPLDSSAAPPVRSRLWQAWATVEPTWLMMFTQPRLLRANPTPFPSAWLNFDLGSLREGEGTYDTWSYDSVPGLPLDEIRGEFQYLKVANVPGDRDDEGYSARKREGFERLLADAAEKEIRLPEAFVRFMGTPALHRTFRSVTDCFFTLPDEHTPIRLNPSGEGIHVHFYCDSQSCLLWDLYVHASGAHCVIAREFEYFIPEDHQPPYPAPRAWFVAPSFEAFVYRVWVENQVWYIENAGFLRSEGKKPPPLTPLIQAYIDFYRNR